jgi:hypothetical protein
MPPDSAAVTVNAVPRTPRVVCCFPPSEATSKENSVSALTVMVMRGYRAAVTSICATSKASIAFPIDDEASASP